ncbi:hypothetical protein, partial [Burkholderia pseudomallei]|uniref:hypothetical protein n=1 Tax=Burkholderia pseudomallei TaxID=28450 RepID=UPI003F688FFC
RTPDSVRPPKPAPKTHGRKPKTSTAIPPAPTISAAYVNPHHTMMRLSLSRAPIRVSHRLLGTSNAM